MKMLGTGIAGIDASWQMPVQIEINAKPDRENCKKPHATHNQTHSYGVFGATLDKANTFEHTTEREGKGGGLADLCSRLEQEPGKKNATQTTHQQHRRDIQSYCQQSIRYR